MGDRTIVQGVYKITQNWEAAVIPTAGNLVIGKKHQQTILERICGILSGTPKGVCSNQSI